MRYGITIFGHSSGAWHKKIDTILKGIFRSIVYGPALQTEEEKLANLGLPFFRAFLVQTVVLKYFWSDIYKIPHVATRSLRHTERFKVPFVTTKYGKKVRDFYVPTIFNSLPDDVYGADSLKKLKRALQDLSKTS